MDMLQRKEFPALSLSPADTIISGCWNGDYVTIQELEYNISGMFSEPYQEAQVGDTIWHIEHQEICREVVKEGIITRLCRVP